MRSSRLGGIVASGLLVGLAGCVQDNGSMIRGGGEAALGARRGPERASPPAPSPTNNALAHLVEG